MSKYLIDVQETVSYSIWIEADDEESAEDVFYELSDANFVDIQDLSVQTDSFGLEFVQVLGIEDENGELKDIK